MENPSLKITEIKVTLSKESKVKAYVSMTLNGVFAVKDVKIIQGKDSVFVAMPCKKGKDGVFRDIAHPINSSTRIYFEQVILKAYEDEQRKQTEKPNHPITVESPKEN